MAFRCFIADLPAGAWVGWSRVGWPPGYVCRLPAGACAGCPVGPWLKRLVGVPRLHWPGPCLLVHLVVQEPLVGSGPILNWRTCQPMAWAMSGCPPRAVFPPSHPSSPRPYGALGGPPLRGPARRAPLASAGGWVGSGASRVGAVAPLLKVHQSIPFRASAPFLVGWPSVAPPRGWAGISPPGLRMPTPCLFQGGAPRVASRPFLVKGPRHRVVGRPACRGVCSLPVTRRPSCRAALPPRRSWSLASRVGELCFGVAGSLAPLPFRRARGAHIQQPLGWECRPGVNECRLIYETPFMITTGRLGGGILNSFSLPLGLAEGRGKAISLPPSSPREIWPCSLIGELLVG